MSDAFWAGARHELEKTAATWGRGLTASQRFVISRSPGKSLADVAKARQRTPRASMATKPKAKKPSRALGLGEQTMDMGDVQSPAQRLQQPPKPPRY